MKKQEKMRPEILYPLFANIESVSGIGQKYAKLFVALCGGNRLKDVLFHLPYNIVDRTYSPKISEAKSGVVCTIRAKVVEHVAPPTRKRPYKIVLEDETDTLVLNFFKYYPSTLQKNFPLEKYVAVSGKIEDFNGIKQMNHPDAVVFAEDFSKLARIEPIYPLTAGLSNRQVEKVAKIALSKLPKFDEWLDENYQKRQQFPSFSEALFRLHNPLKASDLDFDSPYYRRLAYDELLANQLALAISRSKIKKQKGLSVCGNGNLREELRKNLAFSLTSAQENALKDILNDQKDEHKMLRLLQGDVGCGKTVVALFAMLNAVEAGYQAAIMAPTEILATQHFDSISEMCRNIDVRVELLTGRIKGKKRELLLNDLRDGKIDILIGTHALFTEDVEFNNLGFAVIDEQHRFGVHQRLALSAKGKKCDVLVMTATPIPRTLLLTSYGDMDYSQITELPAGRKPVDTRVMPVGKIIDVVKGLARKIGEGARVYWVCPLVEESEKTDLAAAEARKEDLSSVFGEKVGIVHGKMKDAQKDEVMQKFKSGEISLLVATTVIEVGVNVPEATIMVVERAERFGLAQLHQLRGRIKRGTEAGTCILLYGSPLSEVAKDRLEIMKKTEDGFLIAEEDLRLRGGGEILGSKQSGFEMYKIAVLPKHNDLLITAAKDAKLIMQNDENLHSKRGEALKTLLYLFEKDEDLKTYKAG